MGPEPNVRPPGAVIPIGGGGTINGIKFRCMLATSRGLNTIVLHYTARAVWISGGAELDKRTLLLVDQSSQFFFAQCSRDCHRLSLFPVVDNLIPSRDICSQRL